ncbi:protein of unknown function (DUF2062 family) [Peptococcaceae bacterium DYL19]|nr:protein of unknown function (DUF2062 family) [Phosphitispora fastidiosa]
MVNIKDNPHKLAKSIALGFALALLPLPGLNLPLGLILAKLLKFNIIATTLPALLLTYVSPLLYLLNYKTGAIFITSAEAPPQDFEYDLTFWDKVVDFFSHAGPAYLLGSVINALLAATASYFIFLFIYKNAGRFFGGKKIRLVRIMNLQGFLARTCSIKNPHMLRKLKLKKASQRKTCPAESQA